MSKENWLGKAVASMKKRGTLGTFSARAKRAGMSTAAYAEAVLKNKRAYPASVVRQAVFAKNAAAAGRKRARR